MSFQEAADSFLQTRTAPVVHGRVQYIAKGTLKDYQKKLRALGVFFNELPLNHIHLGHFNQYQERRATGRDHVRKLGKIVVQSPAGAVKVNKELALLLRLMKLALASVPEPNKFEPLPLPNPELASFVRNIAQIETHYLRYQAIESDVPRALSQEQQEHFLRVASSQTKWHPIWWYSLVALDLTFSSDEMRTIRQGDVNLTYQIVGVNRRFGKNKFRRRDVPIADGACVWALEQLMERAKRLVGAQPHYFLFPGRVARNHFDGESHMSDKGLRRQFEEVRKAADLPWFQLNGWRHTAITNLAAAGVPIATIMKRAGHVTRKMSEHYTHISEQAERIAVRNAAQKKPVISVESARLRQQVSGY
jgi:integrase